LSSDSHPAGPERWQKQQATKKGSGAQKDQVPQDPPDSQATRQYPNEQGSQARPDLHPSRETIPTRRTAGPASQSSQGYPSVRGSARARGTSKDQDYRGNQGYQDRQGPRRITLTRASRPLRVTRESKRGCADAGAGGRGYHLPRHRLVLVGVGTGRQGIREDQMAQQLRRRWPWPQAERDIQGFPF